MRTFFSTLIGMVVIALVAVGIIGFIFWSRVPDLLSNDLSKKLKVAVHIDDVLLGWNKIKVEKVEIGNPPQSTLSKAFACNSIHVDAPFTVIWIKKS